MNLKNPSAFPRLSDCGNLCISWMPISRKRQKQHFSKIGQLHTAISAKKPGCKRRLLFGCFMSIEDTAFELLKCQPLEYSLYACGHSISCKSVTSNLIPGLPLFGSWRKFLAFP